VPLRWFKRHRDATMIQAWFLLTDAMILNGAQSARDQRRMWALLTLALGAFIAYGSLLPFALDLNQPGRAIQGLARGRSVTDLATNVFLFVPLSFAWFGALRHTARPYRNLALLAVVLAGCAAFSLAIEFAQVYFPPRVPSWLDVLANLLGAAVGLLLCLVVGRPLDAWLAGFLASPLPPASVRAARLASLAALPYLALLAGINGWLTREWLDVAPVLERAGGMHWMPFFHHHAANIVLAFTSSVLYAVSYAPVGALWFMWSLRSTRTRRFETLSTAFWLGAGLGLVMEGGKVLLAELQPDSGNIIIAALGSAVGWLAADGVTGRGSAGSSGRIANPALSAERAEEPVRPALMMFRFAALLLAAGAAAALAAFPIARGWLAAGLVAYGLVLWRYPWAWLIAIPALLPVLDLTPWSGWFYLNEFDLFVLLSLVVGYWKLAGQGLTATLPRAAKALIALVVLSCLASLAKGMGPLQVPDYSAFSNYYSHYSGLIPAKGLLCAVAFLPLLLREVERGAGFVVLATIGITIGVGATGMVALWERLVFTGLTDFTTPFRIAGPFSSMHTGGGHIESYLVLALPFTFAAAGHFRAVPSRALVLLVFVLGVHALAVTFSRSGYVGFVILVGTYLALTMIAGRPGAGKSRRILLLPFGMAALAVVVAVPVLEGRFAQARLGVVAEDWADRVGHWRESLRIMPEGWSTALLGTGLGRFPETYFFANSTGNMPAVFQYVTEGANTFLRLGSGHTTYVEQIVAVEPRHSYSVTFDARSAAAASQVNVLVCERNYFYSAGCVSASLPIAGPDQWKHYTASIASERLGSGPWYARRTVKLSLENASARTVVDLDNVRLTDGNGRELVDNGDFSHGNARWFFSATFNHLPWHIKNLPLSIYFEQGWLGILSFLAFVSYAVAHLARHALRGDSFSSATLAGLAAFVAVGMFDSQFDSARLVLFFYFVLFAGLLRSLVPMIQEAAQKRAVRTPAITRIQPPPAAPLYQPQPAVHASAAPTDNRRRLSSWHGVNTQWLHVFAGIAACTVIGWLVTHAPFVPYNVRELPNPYHPYIAQVILSVLLYWTFGAHAWIAGGLERSGGRIWFYPAAVLLHGAGAWLMLNFAVLPESLHDVVGSPVLGWPWQWEIIGRFTALFGVLSLLFTGAALVVAALRGFVKKRVLLVWAATCALLLPIMHWVVVTQAGTDNLTELMAGGGGLYSSVLLAGYLFVAGSSGALLGACIGGAGGWLRAIVVAVISLPLGYWLLANGTEEIIIKDRQAFSALQFLLSTDRQHYARGVELIARYAVFHAGLVGAIALTQYPFWNWFIRRARPGSGVRAATG